MYIGRNIEKSILEATKEYPVIMACGQRQVGELITLNHIKEKIDNMLVLLTETLED